MCKRGHQGGDPRLFTTVERAKNRPAKDKDPRCGRGKCSDPKHRPTGVVRTVGNLSLNNKKKGRPKSLLFFINHNTLVLNAFMVLRSGLRVKSSYI